MKNELTDVSFVLDRSGSMGSVRQDTIGGFNTFIETQQKEPGECVASLLQFDDQFDSLYSGKPIKDVPKLTLESFQPRGSTALLDAIGMTIENTGKRLAALPEAERPGKVIVVILTDGGENASTKYTREQIFKMISHQRDTYKWDFVFVGANQDAIQTGASIGISSGKSMSYASNAAGTQAVFASAAGYVTRARHAVDANAVVADCAFTADDRKEQAQAGA